MKKHVQRSFSYIFALHHVYKYNFIYLRIFQLSKVDFALQTAAHMSAKPRLFVYNIVCSRYILIWLSEYQL